MIVIDVVFGIYFVFAWFALRGNACFFCGRKQPSKCGCPGAGGKR